MSCLRRGWRLGLPEAQRNAQDAHAPGDFFAAHVSGREDLFDAFFYRFELCVEQAGLYVCQQLLGGQQRVEFGCAEPESGKLEGLPVAQCVVVAVALTVIFNRCIEMQAHLLHDAVDRGARTFEFIL